MEKRSFGHLSNRKINSFLISARVLQAEGSPCLQKLPIVKLLFLCRHENFMLSVCLTSAVIFGDLAGVGLLEMYVRLRWRKIGQRMEVEATLPLVC